MNDAEKRIEYAIMMMIFAVSLPFRMSVMEGDEEKEEEGEGEGDGEGKRQNKVESRKANRILIFIFGKRFDPCPIWRSICFIFTYVFVYLFARVLVPSLCEDEFHIKSPMDPTFLRKLFSFASETNEWVKLALRDTRAMDMP